MRRALVAVCVLAITGCSTAVNIKTPDNKDGYVVKCKNDSIEDCYNTASRVCPSGYEVISNTLGSANSAIKAGQIIVVDNSPNQFVIQCKADANQAGKKSANDDAANAENAECKFCSWFKLK